MSFSVVPTPSLTFGFQPEIQSCSTFIDGIVMSQRFRKDSAKQLVGLRSIAFRQPGDIRFDGTEEQEQDVMPEKLRMAWIQGSHNTKVQTSSDGTLVRGFHRIVSGIESFYGMRRRQLLSRYDNAKPEKIADQRQVNEKG